MSFQVHDGGVWKPVNSFSVKDAGIWKTVQTAYVKNAGAWTQFFTNAVLIDFTVEVWGGGGGVFFTDIPGYPNTGMGGYNKVSVQTLTNRIASFSAGTTSGAGGYAVFSIDSQWIVVAGGGGEPGSYVTWTQPGFSNPVLQSGTAGLPGTGGYNQTGGPSEGQAQVYYPPGGNPDTGYWQVSGAGGGGAPGGASIPPGTALNPGRGGSGNIRCFFDSGTTSGNAAGVATMAYVTGSTGIWTGNAKMTITNTSTGRSRTYTNSATFPISDIVNY